MVLFLGPTFLPEPMKPVFGMCNRPRLRNGWFRQIVSKEVMGLKIGTSQMQVFKPPPPT